jgi:sugar phosphate isomerase/epimerase
MKNLHSRRTFLKSAAVLPFAAAAVTENPFPAAAQQPIPRAGGPELKVSLNAYSFTKLLNDQNKHRGPGVSLFDVLEFCAKNNFDGFDPTGYFFPTYPEVPPDDYVNTLKRRAFELGIGISGTGVRNNFTTSDKTVRAAAVQHIKEWVEVASRLGAPVIRVFADTQMRAMTWHDVAKGCTREQVRDWIIADLKECTAHGKRFGVIIGVQNHGDFLRTSDDLIQLVGLVESPWCGAIVDTGYFRSPDPYVDMQKAAPYAVNWQVKQSAFGAESNIRLDLDRFLHIVRSSGYSGYLPIETLSTPDKPYDPYQIVPPFIQELKAAIARTA